VDPATLWVLVAGGFIVAVGLGWYFSPASRVKRELKSAPRYSLRELPEGTRARIVGAARVFEHTLEGPLTGRP
jgi:hypothetical protein